MGQLQYEEVRGFADILIIGGGIAGLTAAVSAKEKNPEAEVMIVEKQTTGYGGKANKGGGVLQYFDLGHTTPEIFTEYHAHSVGCYLGNQNMMKKYVAMNNEMLERMEGWGVTIPKKRIPTGPMTFIIGVDLNITLQMRRKAEKLGVKIIDKVTISDLLTDEGRIAGAVRAITDKPFAANLFLDTGPQLEIGTQAIIEAKIPVAYIDSLNLLDYDLEKEYYDRFHAAGIKVIAKVNYLEDAIVAEKAGADVIITKGIEGGGHCTKVSGRVLLAEVTEAVKSVPVVASVGIATPRQAAACTVMGAEGIEMGTAFYGIKRVSGSSECKTGNCKGN